MSIVVITIGIFLFITVSPEDSFLLGRGINGDGFLSSINQYWNKRKARLQSIAAKQGQKTTNQLCQLAKKRNFRMQDILRKTARYILDFCISHQIGTFVCGYNRDFKRGLKLGKVTNQHFTQISLSYLRSTLKHLCERYGITYLEQEESYTSQASCLDLDDIPVSGAACTASPTAGRPMPTSTAPPIYFVKVSRTSISRDCVRGFWTAL